MKTKHCTKCKKIKSGSEFYKHSKLKSGLSSWCKSCCKKQSAKYDSRKYRIKYNYNMTLEQHKELYVQQNGCCAICNQPIPYNKIFTDHNHETGKVRELLCNRCNAFLGYVEISPELLSSIFEYLEKHKEK